VFTLFEPLPPAPSATPTQCFVCRAPPPRGRPDPVLAYVAIDAPDRPLRFGPVWAHDLCAGKWQHAAKIRLERTKA
jgi:hypothetical protein